MEAEFVLVLFILLYDILLIAIVELTKLYSYKTFTTDVLAILISVLVFGSIFVLDNGIFLSNPGAGIMVFLLNLYFYVVLFRPIIKNINDFKNFEKIGQEILTGEILLNLNIEISDEVRKQITRSVNKKERHILEKELYWK